MDVGAGEVQARLGLALAANRPDSGVDHVLIALPSYSLGESLLSHYVDRIPALEHRYLLAGLLLARIPSCEMVFISSEAPTPEMVDYQLSLVAPERRDVARRRLRLLTVPDRSARSVAAKLLDRPDLLDELRTFIAGRPALIEPWNVTDAEVEVAHRLGVPINGSPPDVREVAFKSAGRRLFASVGVPVPAGCEDVTDVDGVLAAIRTIRAAAPAVAGVVVKHDDSGAGDGNVVLRFAEHPDEAALRRRLDALPAWYLDDLRRGGVVEALVTGERFTSPSAQVDIVPGGSVRVLATHEQVLGGDGDQVYLGCRFPADPAYAPTLAEHAEVAGRALAAHGALGRASIDFAAARDADGAWRVDALEVNLRKGGTTHPYAALRNLVPGSYDAAGGRWVAAADGSPRCYSSTDNVQDDAWLGRAPGDVIEAVRGAGLQFDPATGTGVVLHMLACLAVDGRFGMTAVGRTPGEADALHEAAVAAVRDAATVTSPT